MHIDVENFREVAPLLKSVISCSLTRCVVLRRMADSKHSGDAKTADSSQFIVPLSQHREPSAIRSLYPLMRLPGMLSFAGGLPNPQTFPISNIEVGLKDGTTLKWTSEQVAEALQYGSV